ncbi:uncharacterized protein B0I36DRAFT_312401 [Microdochium trichocladiopsis]|uniref:BTB domain-containing protein n=1 Tax=Microdochium trichocladiopsis TaxID=1682393 RepID=A0A9P8YJQ8_9PEZI|nr:uncharacterized protein B0I36DRAFT_312401 [Microdochium trichocladiopsis]KAH7041227.1 hypothetical protein B0I36DRAFT_312401 [Microdochium trichocladiopsis]
MIQVAMDGSSSSEHKLPSTTGEAPSPVKMSPYSDVVTLYFADQVLVVHRFVLEKAPKLHDMVSTRTQHRISDISGAAGHILINYLYKGLYEMLPLLEYDRTTAERRINMLQCSFEVYEAARKYQIHDLAKEATIDIEGRTGDLEPSEVLAVLKQACPLPDTSDVWLRGYMRTLLDIAYTSIEAFLASDIMAPENCERTISITEMLLRTMISSTNEKHELERQVREAAEAAEARRKAAEAAEAVEAERMAVEAERMAVEAERMAAEAERMAAEAVLDAIEPELEANPAEQQGLIDDLRAERAQLLKRKEKKGRLLKRDKARLRELDVWLLSTKGEYGIECEPEPESEQPGLQPALEVEPDPWRPAFPEPGNC